MIVEPQVSPQRPLHRGESTAIMLHAEHEPLRGIDRPGTHQTFRNPRTTVATRELPELKDDFVRVQMEYVGVCGTDLHAVQADPATGYMCTSSPTSIPPHGRVLGHEGIGRVLRTGAAVRDLTAEDDD